MLGLVLAGGGAKGAYQVGVLKAFEEWGLKFDVMTGTSVGAINTMLMVQDKFEILYNIWYNLDFNTVVDYNFKRKNKALEIMLTAIPKWGHSTAPLGKLVRQHILYEDIKKSKVRWGIIYTSGIRKYNEAAVDNVFSDMIQDYVMASYSVAPFLHKTYINGKGYKDGWFTDNLPIKCARRLGADKVIAINLMPGFRKRSGLKKSQIFKIKPSVRLGGLLNFNNDHIRFLMEQGYKDANLYKDKIMKFVKEGK